MQLKSMLLKSQVYRLASFFFKFIYFEGERERERVLASMGRAEREGKRIPGRLCTVSAGLDLMNCEIMT